MFTKESLSEYCKTKTQIQADVFYNPYLNRIALVMRGRIVEFMGEKGIFYSYSRLRLGKHDEYVGKLV